MKGAPFFLKATLIDKIGLRMKKDESILPVFKLEGEIFVEPSDGMEGFYSKIVGVKRPLYIIIDNPFPKEGSQKLTLYSPIWVRYFHGLIHSLIFGANP